MAYSQLDTIKTKIIGSWQNQTSRCNKFSSYFETIPCVFNVNLKKHEFFIPVFFSDLVTYYAADTYDSFVLRYDCSFKLEKQKAVLGSIITPFTLPNYSYTNRTTKVIFENGEVLYIGASTIFDSNYNPLLVVTDHYIDNSMVGTVIYVAKVLYCNSNNIYSLIIKLANTLIGLERSFRDRRTSTKVEMVVTDKINSLFTKIPAPSISELGEAYTNSINESISLINQK